MNITEWDPHAASEDELSARFAFNAEIEIEQDPDTPLQTYGMWRQRLLETSPFFESRRWVVKDNDAFVAAGYLGLNRTDDNRHRCHVNVEVAQSHRRLGLGRDLFRLIVDAAEADGRTTLSAGAPKDSVGEQFAAAMGMEQKLLDRRSRLMVNDVDLSLVERWIADAKAKAADYSLLSFDEPAPDEWVERLIELEETMNDAPRDEMDMEDWHQTVEEYRDGEQRSAERGDRWLYLVARHDPTDQLAAFTFISWNPGLPQLAWQQGTAVRREHRGHAIGRWIKAANFQRLRDANPRAEFIDTWNAGSNKWMLAINDDLGFKPYLWYGAYERTIEPIKKAIG